MIHAACARPRMEGAREQEIFLATLDLIGQIGYDRLTLDAVAAKARASKATLYRRWSSKADLVLDAMDCLAPTGAELPDTGCLREDLVSIVAAKGLADPARADVFCGLATAIYRDAELGDRVRRRFFAQGQNHFLILLERAKDRGQLRPDADLDLLCKVIPALVLYQLTFETPGDLPPGFIVRLIDELVMPVVRAGPPAEATAPTAGG